MALLATTRPASATPPRLGRYGRVHLLVAGIFAVPATVEEIAVTEPAEDPAPP
ncbi:MAG TPA: hypothetical protein VGW34_02780 [Allosphingosinicella sp.]|nr:hypothetical protein [Allosphingosinicella sp.]